MHRGSFQIIYDLSMENWIRLSVANDFQNLNVRYFTVQTFFTSSRQQKYIVAKTKQNKKFPWKSICAKTF